MSEVAETTLADDLSAAFDALEEKTEPSASEPEGSEAVKSPPKADSEPVSRETEAKTDEDVPDSAEESTDASETTEKPVETEATGQKEPEKAGEPPPASFRPLAREAWKDVPDVVKAEVRRRETEITTTMQQLTDVRKFADNFAQVIYPYRENIQREGATPLAAVQSLMQVAATLQTGSAAGKAGQIAELVHRYGVDIRELDEALASGVGKESPVIQQRVAEAVKPFQEALQRQQEEERKRQQSQSSTVQQELEAFRSDPKNEFFEDVRMEMADIMDAAARRGQTLTFKDAYEKACALNPDVEALLKMRRDTEEARKRSEQAKQKQRAAKSLPSSSSGDQRRRAAEPSSPHDDLRADIEAALSFGGR